MHEDKDFQKKKLSVGLPREIMIGTTINDNLSYNNITIILKDILVITIF